MGCTGLNTAVPSVKQKSFMKKIALLLAALIVSASSIAADNGGRVIKTGLFPQTKGMIVVAEGDYEPRGIGSYTLRVYAKNDPAYPYDEFLTGTIRPRNGTVESLKFADVDHDGNPEIIVTTRYVGSGNYVTVDAFRLRKKNLQLVTSIAGMDANKDAVQALKKKLGNNK
jgi:hypothetical protein